jgi:hypoxanthine phosphoribosyltransferase
MNQQIKLKDKNFKPFIVEERIAEAVKIMADQLNSDLSNEFPLFLAVLNGSFMFASDLLKKIHIPCEISFIKMKSYEGMKSAGQVTELLGLNEDIANRTVVIIEDIVDTGLTLDRLVTQLNAKKVKQIKVASLLFKPEMYQKNHKIDYFGFSISKDFVVGYGLDYEGQGRNLKEIYILA